MYFEIHNKTDFIYLYILRLSIKQGIDLHHILKYNRIRTRRSASFFPRTPVSRHRQASFFSRSIATRHGQTLLSSKSPVVRHRWGFWTKRNAVEPQFGLLLGCKQAIFIRYIMCGPCRIGLSKGRINVNEREVLEVFARHAHFGAGGADCG